MELGYLSTNSHEPLVDRCSRKEGIHCQELPVCPEQGPNGLQGSENLLRWSLQVLAGGSLRISALKKVSAEGILGAGCREETREYSHLGKALSGPYILQSVQCYPRLEAGFKKTTVGVLCSPCPMKSWPSYERYDKAPATFYLVPIYNSFLLQRKVQHPEESWVLWSSGLKLDPGYLNSLEIWGLLHNLLLLEGPNSGREDFEWTAWVCKGCHNKALQPGWLKQQEIIFSQFWRMQGQGQGVGQGWFLLKLPSLSWKWLFSPSVFTWTSLCVCLCPGILLLWGHQSYPVKAHMTSLNLATSSKALSPNTVSSWCVGD